MLCPLMFRIKPSTTNMCLNRQSEQPNFLLPVVCLSVSSGGGIHNFNCLVDTGSQRSYFSESVLTRLKGDDYYVAPADYEVRTFWGSQLKRLREVKFDIRFPSGTRSLPILIDNQFNIRFDVDCFHLITKNMKNLNFKLAGKFAKNTDTILVHGLLGVDLIQFMKPMHLIKCMGGTAWKLPNGIIPFGNVNNFLYPNQIILPGKGQKGADSNFYAIVSKYSSFFVPRILCKLCFRT